MKRYPAVRSLLIAVFCVSMLVKCSSKKEPGKEEPVKEYQAGDRRGINDSIKDISLSENISELLCQRWDNRDDDESVRAANGGGSLELPMRGFYIFGNSYVVKDPRGDMQIGNWNFDEKNKLVYMTFGGKTDSYKIMALSFDELILKNTSDQSPNVYYKADGLVNRDQQNDPFYPPNMQWRIPAKTSETDEAIRKRLKEHLRFYYLFYTDNRQRNSADISFYGLPGCFKWYAGGIHLKKETELEQSWKNIFHDAKDASRAYGIMDKLISKKYKWGHEDINWLLLNADVLQQMEKKIDSL